MFYAALALIATRNLGTSKHTGVISLFDREFVKTGIFPPTFSKSLHLAFDQRQIHDYGEMIDIDDEIVTQTIEDARQFIIAIEQLLRTSGFLR